MPIRTCPHSHLSNCKAGTRPRATRALPHSGNTFRRHEQLPRSQTNHDSEHPHVVCFTQYSISNTSYTLTISTYIPTTAPSLHFCFTWHDKRPQHLDTRHHNTTLSINRTVEFQIHHTAHHSSRIERCHQMSENRDEITLNPDQLRSVTACKIAIYNIAKNTNKEPLEIWESNEEKLSRQATSLALSNGDRYLRASALTSAAIMAITIFNIEIVPKRSPTEITLGIISTLLYALILFAAIKITFIPHALRIVSVALSLGITIITTILGFISTAPDNTKAILYYLVGAYIYYVPPCMLLCGLLWWMWTSNKNERESRKDQLATLRATLPILTQSSQHTEDSVSDTTKHYTATNTTSKASIYLKLTACILITAGLFRRNRISNK